VNYVGRFAPSPTGALHLGTARTALLAWARARAAGGRFELRMEDLDAPRVRPGSEASILEDLRWLGLDWDGPILRQSARTALYAAALEALKLAGRAYPCTCSRKEVEAAVRAPHAEDEGPAYPGTCRRGVSHPDRRAAWRFRMDAPEPWVDGRLGPQPGLADDFVLCRADGVFSYQLACAVDDAEQGVTEVVRAEDLAGSASRQQALLKALGRAHPAWWHGPLLRGPDGARLSKRHASIGVAAFRKAGWSPERLGGLLAASLGWTALGEEVPARAWIAWVDRPIVESPVPLSPEEKAETQSQVAS
jgi:glutamyl-tRNA synthetase